MASEVDGGQHAGEMIGSNEMMISARLDFVHIKKKGQKSIVGVMIQACILTRCADDITRNPQGKNELQRAPLQKTKDPCQHSFAGPSLQSGLINVIQPIGCKW